MIKRTSVAVGTVSLILVVYCILINFNAPLKLVYFIFSISPILVIWMVYTVLRHGSYNGNELQADEEWGYQDVSKDELGVL